MATEIVVDFGLDIVFLSDGAKPLREPMFTYHQ